MKKLLTATAVVALLVGPALAQSTPPSPNAPPTEKSPSAPMDTTKPMDSSKPAAMPDQKAEPQFMTEQGSDQYLASNLIGATVFQADGKTSIGDINDLVTDGEGKVVGVVIGVGGFLGLGEKWVGLNFDALEISRGENASLRITLNATADQLKSAPDFKTLADINAEAARAPANQPAAPAPAGTPPRQ